MNSDSNIFLVENIIVFPLTWLMFSRAFFYFFLNTLFTSSFKLCCLLIFDNLSLFNLSKMFIFEYLVLGAFRISSTIEIQCTLVLFYLFILLSRSIKSLYFSRLYIALNEFVTLQSDSSLIMKLLTMLTFCYDFFIFLLVPLIPPLLASIYLCE
jgi:hypothetical protein